MTDLIVLLAFLFLMTASIKASERWNEHRADQRDAS